MDALMAALVVAALAGIGDRPAWLAAILADRYRRPGAMIAAAALALAVAGLLAALAGRLIAPMLTPEAKLMMLAIALALQGGGGLFRAKTPDRLEGWRLGAFATSAAGLFILLFGDGVQFVVLALAARSTVPWLAAAGATVGGLAVIGTAVTLGEAAWLRLPLYPIRLGASALFLLAAVILAVQALALV